MKDFLKYFLTLFFLTTCYLLLTTNIHAQNFRNDYQVEYFLSEAGGSLSTRAKFTITITNLVSDLYVKKFTIGFPSSFQIKNIKGYDDLREIPALVESSEDTTKITLEFSDPKLGKNSENTFYLEFNQDNLFKVNGNIWEVILPTVESKENGFYKILLHLPANSRKKLSISKPVPDNITGTVITWNNPKVKTIQAVFGEVQYYQADLAYHLSNDKLIPAYTDIAFPPDTQTQKMYVQSINPPPVQVMIDPDGNYLGRYILKPKENLTVLFSGTIAEYATVREEVVSYIRSSFVTQKAYLFLPQDLWNISSLAKIKNVSIQPKDIYQFVSSTLKYDYDKINSDNRRLGAEEALRNPTWAVCMEFTDLFVGIARQKGIYAREIEGYGFSEDPKIRPLSLASDILHSWPEYYDPQSELWIPVDPTWENTSGIDYFSSFDLNHITFAIHGKDPNYPLPAGTYKVGSSRDIVLRPTANPPRELENLLITNTPLVNEINDSRSYQLKIDVENRGNTYYWGKGIVVLAKGIEATVSKPEIAPLPPHGKATVLINYKAATKVSRKSTGSISIALPQGKSITGALSIIPFYYVIALNLSIGLGCAAILMLILLLRRKSKNSVQSRGR